MAPQLTLQLATPRLCNYPGGTHYNFDRYVSETIKGSPEAVKTALGPLAVRFDGLLALEAAHMEWTRKSALTEYIARASSRLDHSLAAVSSHVDSALYSDDRDVTDAAERLRVMLKQYGYVGKKAYNVKSGDIQAILGNLLDDYASDVAALGLEARTADLQHAHNEFEALLQERDAAKKPAGNLRKAQREIDGVYRQIARVVNANLIAGTDGFAALAGALNPLIERLNLQHHTVKHDIRHVNVAQIPAQIHTGLPITPPPEVTDGAVLLELGKDYNVTYKNNVNVGKAECTIHGKGLYKGTTTATFVIVMARGGA